MAVPVDVAEAVPAALPATLPADLPAYLSNALPLAPVPQKLDFPQLPIPPVEEPILTNLIVMLFRTYYYARCVRLTVEEPCLFHAVMLSVAFVPQKFIEFRRVAG